MGLPLVTMRGRAFAARMGASLLTAVGQPGCIASDLVDHEELAEAIATSPQRHAQLRAHLVAGAWERTLGDAQDFARRFEAALVEGYERSVIAPAQERPAP